jgi:hypothetical protein
MQWLLHDLRRTERLVIWCERGKMAHNLPDGVARHRPHASGIGAEPAGILLLAGSPVA